MSRRVQRPMEEWDDTHKHRDRRPSKTVIVPPQYYRCTRERERRMIYDAWKANTGCDVLAFGNRSQGEITRFEVFGTKSLQAVKEINEWIINSSTKSSESTAWPKLNAFDANKYGYDLLRKYDYERKQMFKGRIPDGLELRYRVG
jgi:hypothetical protein